MPSIEISSTSSSSSTSDLDGRPGGGGVVGLDDGRRSPCGRERSAAPSPADRAESAVAWLTPVSRQPIDADPFPELDRERDAPGVLARLSRRDDRALLARRSRCRRPTRSPRSTSRSRWPRRSRTCARRAPATSSAASPSDAPGRATRWYIGRRHIEDDAARAGGGRLAGADRGAVLPGHRCRPVRAGASSAVHAGRRRAHRLPRRAPRRPRRGRCRDRACPTRCWPRSVRLAPARCARSWPPSRPSRTWSSVPRSTSASWCRAARAPARRRSVCTVPPTCCSSTAAGWCATACWWWGRTRCSSTTSATCCRRSASAACSSAPCSTCASRRLEAIDGVDTDDARRAQGLAARCSAALEAAVTRARRRCPTETGAPAGRCAHAGVRGRRDRRVDRGRRSTARCRSTSAATRCGPSSQRDLLRAPAATTMWQQGHRAARRCCTKAWPAHAAGQAGRPAARRARPRPVGKKRRWTVADQLLVDEANSLLNGTPFTFGHVVVDEAQDHSAVALRVIGRRSPAGSMTVLGDLAQSTTPAGQQRLGRRAAPPRARRPRIGRAPHHRVPRAGPILDVANRLLPLTEVTTVASRSVRTEGDAPSLRLVRPPNAGRRGRRRGAAGPAPAPQHRRGRARARCATAIGEALAAVGLRAHRSACTTSATTRCRCSPPKR